MQTIAAGGVRLAEVASAFAGCPRMEALCENYMDLPGMIKPPTYNIRSMAAQHGAVLVVYQDDSYKVFVHMGAALSTRHSQCGTAKTKLYRAARLVAERQRSRVHERRSWEICVAAFESNESHAVRDKDVRWLTKALNSTCLHSNGRITVHDVLL